MFITSTATGPRITTEDKGYATVIFANGVEIARMHDTLEEREPWVMIWHDGTEHRMVRANTASAVLDTVHDVVSEGLTHFRKVFPMFPAVQFRVLDHDRENATEDSPVRVQWAGREIATAITVTNEDGHAVSALLTADESAPLTPDLFYTWSGIANWISAQIPDLVS